MRERKWHLYREGGRGWWGEVEAVKYPWGNLCAVGVFSFPPSSIGSRLEEKARLGQAESAVIIIFLDLGND